MTLSALPYYGGKSGGHGSSGRGRWIASLLPGDTRTLYAEPYAGMLGILLQRAPAKLEIVNDLNERIVNWWRVVRDHPDELAQMMRYTPHSEAEYAYALDHLDTGSDIQRANNLTTVLMQSMIHGDSPSSWSCRYFYKKASGQKRYNQIVDVLSRRIHRVQLFCRPASKIIERVGRESESIMYIDPPYRYADTSHYSVVMDEREALLALLPRARGKVAISGYGDEWDELDWHRNEFATTWSGIAAIEAVQPRTEVLWTNYRAEENGRLV